MISTILKNKPQFEFHDEKKTNANVMCSFETLKGKNDSIS